MASLAGREDAKWRPGPTAAPTPWGGGCRGQPWGDHRGRAPDLPLGEGVVYQPVADKQLRILWKLPAFMEKFLERSRLVASSNLAIKESDQGVRTKFCRKSERNASDWSTAARNDNMGANGL